MTLIASNLTAYPRGIARGYMLTPLSPQTEWAKIPRTGRPWVMVDREEAGANLLYNCWRKDMSATDIAAACTLLRRDIERVRNHNPTARIGCWSVPGTEDTHDTTERRMDNRFAWPVVARCDYCLLNGYLWYPAPADYWIVGCARIVREEFNRPIVYGVQPIYAGGEHQLTPIDEARFAEHCRDIRSAGASIWYWGEFRQTLQVGHSGVVNNDIDAALVAAFERNHPDKLNWTAAELAAWCDELDRRSLKIIKGVFA